MARPPAAMDEDLFHVQCSQHGRQRNMLYTMTMPVLKSVLRGPCVRSNLQLRSDAGKLQRLQEPFQRRFESSKAGPSSLTPCVFVQ